MKTRIMRRVIVMISMITAAILVLLQKGYFDKQSKFWFTASGKEIYELTRNNISISRASRNDSMSTKHQSRKKEMIETSSSYATIIEMMSSHKRIHTEPSPMLKRRTHRNTKISSKNILKKKTTNQRRHQAKQNVLKTGMIKQQSSTEKAATTVATIKYRKTLNTNCPKWKYKREDWTIIYHASQANYNTMSCPKPWIGKNIKRISFEDHTFLNTGCNKNTRECKERPFYDFQEGIRINTPPCCRHHVLTMLDHVTTELKTQGVSHSMISGGVIGWVRNKRMIPYDRDLDLIVQINYWNSTEFWNTFQRLHEQHGYVVDDVEDFKVKLYLSKWNRNNIDIWAYWADNKTVSIYFHGFKEQSVKTMFPFKAVKFEWFHTFVPAKPIEYLDRQYGKEAWRPEKHCMVRNSEGDCW